MHARQCASAQHRKRKTGAAQPTTAPGQATSARTQRSFTLDLSVFFDTSQKFPRSTHKGRTKGGERQGESLELKREFERTGRDDATSQVTKPMTHAVVTQAALCRLASAVYCNSRTGEESKRARGEGREARRTGHACSQPHQQSWHSDVKRGGFTTAFAVIRVTEDRCKHVGQTEWCVSTAVAIEVATLAAWPSR